MTAKLAAILMAATILAGCGESCPPQITQPGFIDKGVVICTLHSTAYVTTGSFAYPTRLIRLPQADSLCKGLKP